MTRLSDLPGEPDEPDRPDDPPIEPMTGPDPPDGSAEPSERAPGLLGLDLDSSRLRRGHVVVVAVLLLIAVIGAAVLVLRHRPVEEPVGRAAVLDPATPPTTPTPPDSTSDPGSPVTAEPDALLVHVAGKVRHPGVVRLRPGARVVDAVRASGGMLPGVDAATINLAQPLADGQQVLVGVTPPPGQPYPSATGPPPPEGTSTTPTEPIDLNLATIEQLDELPGIGPVLAERILQARTERGGFTSVDELREVSGIGEKRYADISSLVTVG